MSLLPHALDPVDAPKRHPNAVRVPQVAAFVLVHVPLAILMRTVPLLGALHAIACVLVGVHVAARRPLRDTPLVVSYIVGSELLWRMTRAGVFWEFGKYAVSFVLVIALMRMKIKNNRVLALGYFLLLIPGAAITIGSVRFDLARMYISFNLSGPLSLCVCVLFFSNLQLRDADIRRIFIALIGPVMGMATLTLLSTATTAEIEFTNASNYATSGGFSATQVSPILGLGALFSILLMFERNLSWRTRLPLIALTIFFAVEAALTFSRGGLALAFASTLCASLYLVRNGRSRATLVVLAVLLFGVGKYLVVPRLETFTRGKFSQRYSSSDSSGRSLLANYDIQIFKENFVLGVGPGMATPLRRDLGHVGSAHTEFTRLLAEHGVLGVLALAFIVVLIARVLLTAKTPRARSLAAAMTVWVVLFLTIYAMRLAAPAFIFGIACAVAYSSARPRAGDHEMGLRRGTP